MISDNGNSIKNFLFKLRSRKRYFPSPDKLPPTPPTTPAQGPSSSNTGSLPKGNLREVIPAVQAVMTPPAPTQDKKGKSQNFFGI